MAPDRTSKPPHVRVARVYDERAASDGTRVLVDRLWPRGIRKDDDRYDEWLKDVAPSNDLRKWYEHDPAKYDRFRARYLGELAMPPAQDAWRTLWRMSRAGPVTLVTASKAVDISQAAVLADLLTATSGSATSSGGDPACWLNQVCPECGAIADDRSSTTCPACGAALPTES